MITVPNRYVECRLVPPGVGEPEQVPRERIVLELGVHARGERVEAAAPIHRRRGHEHPRGGRETQHGGGARNRSSHGSAAALRRRVKPSGRGTSATQEGGPSSGAQLTPRSSGRALGTLARGLRQRSRVDRPRPCCWAHSPRVRPLRSKRRTQAARSAAVVRCRRHFPVTSDFIPPS